MLVRIGNVINIEMDADGDGNGDGGSETDVVIGGT